MPLIRIAISGGGLAGAALLLGLLKYPQLDVHVFESAKSFKYVNLVKFFPQNLSQRSLGIEIIL